MTAIQIYSRPHCVYCTKAKAFLKEKNIPFEEVFMDPLEDDDYETKRDELLLRANGQKTFPFVFVGTEFLGGYTELVRAHDTMYLHDLLKRFGVTLEIGGDF